jgi:hypothetical protein
VIRYNEGFIVFFSKPDKILSYFEFYRIGEMAFLSKNTVKQFTVFVLPTPRIVALEMALEMTVELFDWLRSLLFDIPLF